MKRSLSRPASSRAILTQLAAVGLVVDGEVAVEVEAVGVLAQQAGAEAVEGADPDAAAGHEGLDALAHLAGGLVGEGDGEDVAGPDALLEQVGDAAGDDARLAAAGAGQDEQRPFDVRDGLALGVGQVGEQVARGHRRLLRGRAGRAG